MEKQAARDADITGIEEDQGGKRSSGSRDNVAEDVIYERRTRRDA